MFSGLRIFSSTIAVLGRTGLNVFWDANRECPFELRIFDPKLTNPRFV